MFQTTKLRKNYGEELTSYDVLKAATLIAMLIFHVWYFFLPQARWFYVPGVLWPAWFFLMGYARSRDVPWTWLAGGAAIVVSSMLAGSHFFPLNILFTFALIRLGIDPVARMAQRGSLSFFIVFLILLICALPSGFFLEYGTFGMLWSLYGYVRRNPEAFNIAPPVMGLFMAVLVLITPGLLILFLPALSPMEYMAMTGAGIGVFMILFRFEPVFWTGLPGPVSCLVPILQFLGRWTLEIYVVHLLAFRGISFLLYPERWHFMQFHILPFELFGH